MTEAKKKPGLFTPVGVLTFPNLWVPKEIVAGDGKPVYNCSILFSPEAQKTPEYAALKAAAGKAFKEKFPDKKPSGENANPFRDAATKEYEGYKEGWVYISPKTKNPPGVVSPSRRPISAEEGATKVWSGQLVRANLSVYAWEKGSNRGVSFGLNAIQICKFDCRRLDGRLNTPDLFDDGLVFEEEDELAGDLPTNELVDDDIPF